MNEGITVAGGGSFGTALAHVLAICGHRPFLWLRDKELAACINERHENVRYLPGKKLQDGIQATNDPSVLEAPVVVLALPCQRLRGWLTAHAHHFRQGALFCNVAKGLEIESLATCSRIIFETLGHLSPNYAVLSGPSFAREVVEGLPTAVVLAAKDPLLGRRVRDLFSCSFFRCYFSQDVTGVEMGGALKNVIALAAGLCDGLGLGHNSRAALITRGLAEIRRLGVALGGMAQTFMGLSGLGDLTLTCTGDLSRNRQVGLALAAGESLAEVSQRLGMVAEGVTTTRAAYTLAHRLGCEAPLTEAVHAVLYDAQAPRDVLKELLSRRVRDENE